MDIEQAIDLTETRVPYTMCRGNPGFTTYSARNYTELQTYSVVSFSIHALTHCELPWCIEEQMKEIRAKSKKLHLKDLPPHEEMNEVLKDYAKVVKFDAVVIDLTYKRDRLRKEFVDRESGHIYEELDSHRFGDLMKLLKITRDDFSKIEDSRLQDKFLLFRTGWTDFNLRTVDLNNPYFELRHPYLCNPYLDTDLARWLVLDKGVKGMGSDSYGLDNPICYCHPHYVPKYARTYYYDTEQAPEVRCVLSLLVTERRYYLKNLLNLDKITTNEGELLIIPFVLGTRDANLAKVFFWNKSA